MRAIDLNSSPARCWVVPTPAEAKVSVPGCARASATSSLTLFAGTSLLTTKMLGVKQSWVIGAKSLTGSNGSLG